MPRSWIVKGQLFDRLVGEHMTIGQLMKLLLPAIDCVSAQYLVRPQAKLAPPRFATPVHSALDEARRAEGI